MKYLILILFLLSLFLPNCASYDCDDLEYKEDICYEKATGKLANGTYKCTEVGNGGGGAIVHVTEYNYINGLGAGKWSYHAQEQLIQNGEYLDFPELKNLIKSKTHSEIVEIEAWYEGNYGQLNIYIRAPKQDLDSLSSLEIMQNHTLPICSKYELEKVVFRQGANKQWKHLSFKVN